jgi:group II intron reverse transcriptase/maturase
MMKLIKKFLKAGVMENGVVIETTEGSPQGGNLSPLLANIFLNEFDMEYARRGVPEIRYADDIVLLARSKRAAERLLEGSCAYLEGKLKLKVNREKSRIVSLASNRGNFKFLGFNMGKGRSGKFHIYAYKKSKTKFKAKLKDLTSRKRPGTFQLICSELNRVVIGWLNYYGIAEMKKWISATNGWLQSRIRQIIWKRWKKPITKYRKLVHLGTPPKYAYMAANSRRGYWFTIHTGAVLRALSNEKLEGWGLVNLIKAYERIHSYPVQLQFMF